MADDDCSCGGAAALNTASGNLSVNKIAPSAKASVVDASGTTINFNRDGKHRREPFLTAAIRARLQAKAQKITVDSTLEQIEKVEQSDIEEHGKQAIVATLNRALAHQLNLDDIMDKAVNSPNLNENADPSKLDPEWAEKFEEHAGSKYTEEAQEIWARLLTGELNEPGTFSRKTMSILDDMEREDAEAFSLLCSRCAGGDTPDGEWQQLIPLFIGKGEELEIPVERLSRLKGLGLINFDLANGDGLFISTALGDGGWQVLRVGNRTLGVRFPQGKGYQIHLNRLTRFGEELARLCDIGKDLEADSLLVNKFKSAGGEVTLVLNIAPDGRFQYLLL